ncbi:MAG: tetratricopeptide repeat protein [Chitinophagaceae bacterium]|nr:tetratricopeptide repeat protein [Chitinophagaceae bacterium]
MKNLFTLVLILVSGTAFAHSLDSSFYFFEKGIEEKTARRYLVASNHFENAIHHNPNYTAAYIENGLVNKEMRRTDAAKQNFLKAFELDNSNEVAIKELVELYYSYRQFQNAINFALKCKTCSDADRIIAQSYYELEDYGKAEKLLLNLVAKDPADAVSAYTLARTYLEMGQEGKSIPFYVKALQLDNTKSKWHFELGLIYYNTDNYKNAVASFNKAAEHGIIRTNDFNENLGFAYLYTGDYENGENLLKEIIARKPGDKELLRDIGQAFYDRKMYDKCLAYCQMLMEMDMKDGKALYQAGLCFQKKGEKEKGQMMCDKAIELDPSLAGKRHKKEIMGL